MTESQLGMEPIRAGRFHVHTPDHPPSDEPGVRSFVIPASQAFGTGQHETTAGCLVMLGEMKRRGVIARRIADIGTGTGLLAFAALDLWPRAHAVASDIDPVCGPVVAENAAANGFAMGAKAGQVAIAIAAGMDDPDLRACGPYDLLIANILAGPLVELAGDFAEAVPPRGNLLLAGLLETQERARARRLSRGRVLARRRGWSMATGRSCGFAAASSAERVSPLPHAGGEREGQKVLLRFTASFQSCGSCIPLRSCINGKENSAPICGGFIPPTGSNQLTPTPAEIV